MSDDPYPSNNDDELIDDEDFDEEEEGEIEVDEEEEEEGEPEGEDETSVDPASVVSNIQGVGPKTGQKLVAAGYDSIKKIMEAEAEELAAAISGFSVAKAEAVIDEARALQDAIDAGIMDLTGKPKKSKRKKAQEPDPEKHELPPAEILKANFERTSLITGLDTEKAALGIPIGPKWLTKFEKARIIGARALQISMGAPILVPTSAVNIGLYALAEMELRSGVLPMTIRRTKPTGEYNDVPLQSLIKHTRLD